MSRPVHRIDQKEEGTWQSSEVSKAKGREALRDMLPLIETYLSNPTKYCWERLREFYNNNIETIESVNLQDQASDAAKSLLSSGKTGNYNKDQGVIYLQMTMLKELILNALQPERNR